MNAIAVRPLASGDLPAVARLYGASFDEPYPEPVATSLLLTPGAWGMLGLIGTGGKATPAGFLIARAIVDEVEILSVGTSPAWRRHGVARALLSHALEVAERGGAQVAHLEVGEDNPGAMALYRALGFRRTGRRPDYYRRADRTRVAAVLMSLALKTEQ